MNLQREYVEGKGEAFEEVMTSPSSLVLLKISNSYSDYQKNKIKIKYFNSKKVNLLNLKNFFLGQRNSKKNGLDVKYGKKKKKKM